MDPLIALFFLDYASGGRDTFIRSILIVSVIFMTIGTFLANPILGMIVLLGWGAIALACAITRTGWRVIGISAGTVVLLIVVGAMLMRR